MNCNLCQSATISEHAICNIPQTNRQLNIPQRTTTIKHITPYASCEIRKNYNFKITASGKRIISYINDTIW